MLQDASTYEQAGLQPGEPPFSFLLSRTESIPGIPVTREGYPGMLWGSVCTRVTMYHDFLPSALSAWTADKTAELEADDPH